MHKNGEKTFRTKCVKIQEFLRKTLFWDSREGCGGSARCRQLLIFSARLETVSLLAPIGSSLSWFGISKADKMLNSSFISIGDATQNNVIFSFKLQQFILPMA
jgi:hypothetical protein